MYMCGTTPELYPTLGANNNQVTGGLTRPVDVHYKILFGTKASGLNSGGWSLAVKPKISACFS